MGEASREFVVVDTLRRLPFDSSSHFGFSISYALSIRFDLINERNVSTPCPPLRPQLCLDRFISAVMRTLLAASTTPELMRKPSPATFGGLYT